MLLFAHARGQQGRRARTFRTREKVIPVRDKAHKRLKAFLLCLVVLFGSVGLTVFGPASPVRADDGGYPHATMACIHAPYATDGTGYWCSGYSWGPNHNNPNTIYSTRGYAYRNCTDYVAWKLQSLGVASGWTSGLGNGGDWYTNAANKSGLDRGTVPKVGAAAIVPSDTPGYGGYGHVAYVEKVDKDANGAVTSITVSEYNYDLGGHFGTRTGKPSSMKFTQFVYFGDKMTDPPGNPGSGGSTSSTPAVLAVKRTTDPSGVRQVYAATQSAVTEAWWVPGGDGVHTSEIIHIAQGNIVGFDKVNLPDGKQALYTAVPDGIWETWWGSDGALHHNQIITGMSGVRQVIADNRYESGEFVHRLYVLAQDGPHGVWWKDGGDGIHNDLLDSISGPVTMTNSIGPDGAYQLYVATPSWVYELWWFSGGGIHHGGIMNISQGDIRSLGKGGNLPDGGQLLYTGTSTTAWQSYWNSGTGVSHGTIAQSQVNAIQIEKDVYNGVHQLYLATGDHVQEYWWNGPNSGTSTLIDIAQNNIKAFDKSNDGADQQVYTASGDIVWETWWRSGVGPTSSILFHVSR